jgi:hypothetical protein
MEVDTVRNNNKKEMEADQEEENGNKRGTENRRLKWYPVTTKEGQERIRKHVPKTFIKRDLLLP